MLMFVRPLSILVRRVPEYWGFLRGKALLSPLNFLFLLLNIFLYNHLLASFSCFCLIKHGSFNNFLKLKLEKIAFLIHMEYFLSEVNVGQLFWFRGVCYQKSSDHRFRGCFRCLDPDGRPVFISGDPLVKACFFQESLF